jgi:hypothetical protein
MKSLQPARQLLPVVRRVEDFMIRWSNALFFGRRDGFQFKDIIPVKSDEFAISGTGDLGFWWEAG